jgi:hypothetical protein
MHSASRPLNKRQCYSRVRAENEQPGLCVISVPRLKVPAQGPRKTGRPRPWSIMTGAFWQPERLSSRDGRGDLFALGGVMRRPVITWSPRRPLTTPTSRRRTPLNFFLLFFTSMKRNARLRDRRSSGAGPGPRGLPPLQGKAGHCQAQQPSALIPTTFQKRFASAWSAMVRRYRCVEFVDCRGLLRPGTGTGTVRYTW